MISLYKCGFTVYAIKKTLGHWTYFCIYTRNHNKYKKKMKLGSSIDITPIIIMKLIVFNWLIIIKKKILQMFLCIYI